MSRKGLIIGAMAMLIVAFPAFAEEALACPDCKSTLDRSGQYIAVGYAASIALLLGTPLLTLIGWAVALKRALGASTAPR